LGAFCKFSETFTGNAVEGCANALREELKPFGIDVVTLDSSSVPAEALFSAPLPYCKYITEGGGKRFVVCATVEVFCFSALSEIEGTPTQYSAEVLTQSALNVIDHALWDARPYNK
jgi:3-hydroxybutyrate dehydrogenase